MGETTDGKKVALKDHSRTGHVQIVGATGRGKTESVIIPWMIQDIIQGKSTVLIDAKGDGSILERVRSVYNEMNLPEQELCWFDLSDIEGSCKTNPLKYGSPQQIADRLFSSFTFENAYFKSVSYEGAFLVIEALRESLSEVTFERIYDNLTDDEALTGLISSLNGSLQKRALKLLGEPFRARMEKWSGLISQLQPFAKGELSPLLNGGEKKSFSLSELIDPSLARGNAPKAAIILIPTLLYQETAAQVGKLLLQEVAWAVASREKRGYRMFTSIFLDEFSSFVYPGFLSLLNKARSTGCGIHLSHQSLGDLEAVSHEFAKTLNANTNVKCILGVNDPETADFFAKHFGTKDSEKTTERVMQGAFGDYEKTGHMSLRETQSYKINPNKLREFSQGMGALSLIVNGRPITEEIQFFRSPF